MRILVIGSGGREHTLCWALKKSRHTEELFCIPGNAGIAQIATCTDLRLADFGAIAGFVREHGIELVVIGPEAPLVGGLADTLREAGVKVFGPSKKAAAIEGSKAFAKELMRRHNIPTAPFKVFTDATEAIKFACSQEGRVVITADGLAAGKGVLLPETPSEAAAAVQKVMVERAFGEAGSKVLVEQFLTGEEVSVMAFADGRNFLTMVAARDHKRIYDDDRGPNTGGMGAYAPTRIIDEEVMDVIARTIIEPTIEGMREDGCPFTGCLYTGLMMTEDGPRVLEFNCRFGDPETQVVLPLLQSDLVEIMVACADGELDLERVSWLDEIAVCVILAARGYPGKYDKGIPISGLDSTTEPETYVFHAGTAREGGRIVTAGGRILGVTSRAGSYERAVARAYDAVDKIRFKGMQYRGDIGYKAGVDRKARSQSQGRVRYSGRGPR
jgi:phosphoribosylamine--glycine ligase